MATKRCKNGHLYDESIYGDHCPLCPSTGSETIMNPGGGMPAGDIETRTMGNFGGSAGDMGGGATVNISNGGGSAATVTMDPVEAAGSGSHTRIQRIPVGGATGTPDNMPARKVKGVLVSYDTNPIGDIFRLYEGKNMIGRKSTCDVPIIKDNNVSGEHVLILYREVEGIFWLIDNNSSNGTYLNGTFAGEKVKLNSGDIIKIGDTRLIFWAIPNII